jgi:uncharacterized protein (DUF1697 family)
MPTHTHISLLRGINVGGNKIIPMKELKALYESLGFTNVRTLLATGNIAFESAQEDAAALKAQIEAGIVATFGFDSVVFMRTPDDLCAVIEACPFGEAERAEGGKLLVMFLQAAPAAANIQRLRDEQAGTEIFHVINRELYAFYPDGMGRSKLGNPQLERKLGVLGTGRNWNTVLKTLALAQKS